MLGARYLMVALLVASLFACSKDSQNAPEGASQGDAVEAMTLALNQALAEAQGALIEAAKVNETLERQEKKLKGARVDRRLPVGALDTKAMREVLNSYAKMHGLGSVALKLGKADKGKALGTPEKEGEAYSFETSQVIGSAPVAITLDSTDEARLKAYFKAVVKLQLPLMVLPTLLVKEGKATFSGTVYFRRDVKGPERKTRSSTLVEMAKAKGVTLTEEESKLTTLRSLHAQLSAKRALVAKLLKDKDRVAMQGRILQFLRNKAKEIESQTVPKIVHASPAQAQDSQSP